MRTAYQSVFEPFVLRSNVIFFHDWRYVSHGGTRWQDDEGKPIGLWGADPIPLLRWNGADIPSGIELKIITAQKTEPIITEDQPWEGMIGAPTVINQDGRYRLWYEVVPPEDIISAQAGGRNMLCYAESDDGVNWKKPMLGRGMFQGMGTNNIVYGGPIAPEWGYHGGSVFIDPTCDPSERYKVIHLGFISRDKIEDYINKYPDEIDPHNGRMKNVTGVFGAVSPDGLNWKALPDPLVLQVSDTQNTAYYDSFLKKYVAYFRTWVMGRRSIGRAESDDFRHFPLPETIIWPEPNVGPSDTWYANAKTVYPNTTDYHILFPKRWCIAEDRFYAYIATSPDGILWGFPKDSQILTPGDFGSWDTGGVSMGCGMVELPNDRVGVPFIGYRVPHKYPRRVPLGEIALAYWEKGRIIALEAKEKGEFRTSSVIFNGNELHLNFLTKYVGNISIEVLGSNGKPMPNRAFEDCDRISGNSLDHKVTWHGESHINRNPDEPVSFRIRMSYARLFSMTFV